MALANFFSKAAASAADVLSDFDGEAFRKKLEGQVVGLAFDAAAVGSPEGRATLDLAVRCLARLYPKVCIRPIGEVPDKIVADVRSLALAINPDLEAELDPETLSVCLTVGNSVAGAPVEIFVGSDRWIARVSNQRPLGSGRSRNPFGAGGAACLGAANVFRAIFGEQLRRGQLDAEGQLSLLNFETGEAAANGPLPAGLDLTSVTLVGLGAIGNGTVWAWARLPAVVGKPFVVEPEGVELSNLQRYVLALQRHVGRQKLDLAQQAFARTKVDPVLILGTWADFVEGIGHAPLERVAAALDSAKDRIQVQAALPRRVFNAWTQTGDLGVSRHDFLEGPCLACLYLPARSVRHQDELIGIALGLPQQEHRHRLREMLVRGGPVGIPFTQEVAAALNLPPNSLSEFAEMPLQAFYRKAICGGVVLELGGGAGGVEAPLVFQSAMAGVMLGADLIADLAGPRTNPLPVKSVMDITRPLPQRLGVRMARAKRNDGVRCICEDPDFVGLYRARYTENAG